MQYIGAFFISTGMLAIAGNKFKYNKSIVPHSVHSVMGIVTLLLYLVQIYVGIEKMASPTKIRRWHGNAGLATWDFAVVTMLLGMVSFFYISWFNLIVVMLLLCLWLSVHLQFRADAPSTGMTDSEEGYEVGSGGLLIADSGESAAVV